MSNLTLGKKHSRRIRQVYSYGNMEFLWKGNQRPQDQIFFYKSINEDLLHQVYLLQCSQKSI